MPVSDIAQTDSLLELVNRKKDVDGLCRDALFDAATPTAINWLLAGYGVDIKHRKVAIVGRGRLVGAPLERMWRNSGVAVTVFEKGDELQNLKAYDLIVTATGAPGLITDDMIQQGAIIVDAGVAVEKGQLVGDVSAEVRLRRDISITPVRGGVLGDEVIGVLAGPDEVRDVDGHGWSLLRGVVCGSQCPGMVTGVSTRFPSQAPETGLTSRFFRWSSCEWFSFFRWSS